MNFKRLPTIIGLLVSVVVFTGCATHAPYDYSAFKESRPKSILVLPPVNETPDVSATYSVLSYATRPLAEAGYYVMPVTLVVETFKENGLTQPSDMHATSPAKLQEIFGADAALYIVITEYGTAYRVVNSETAVAAEARLMDLKTGKTLWTGAARASSAEGDSQQSGIVALLVTAIVNQVIASTTDKSSKIAVIATSRLLAAGQKNGLLYGPRSPNFGKE